MITYTQAIHCDKFYSLPREGKCNCYGRAGKTEVWWEDEKEYFRIPVKRMHSGFPGFICNKNFHNEMTGILTKANHTKFLVLDPTNLNSIRKELKLSDDAPQYALFDKLIDDGYEDVLEVMKRLKYKICLMCAGKGTRIFREVGASWSYIEKTCEECEGTGSIKPHGL